MLNKLRNLLLVGALALCGTMLSGCGASTSTQAQELLDGYNEKYNAFFIENKGEDYKNIVTYSFVNNNAYRESVTITSGKYLNSYGIKNYVEKKECTITGYWQDTGPSKGNAQITKYVIDEADITQPNKYTSLTDMLELSITEAGAETTIEKDGDKTVVKSTYLSKEENVTFEGEKVTVERTEDGETKEYVYTFTNIDDENYFTDKIQTMKKEADKSNTSAQMVKKLNIADKFK